MKKSIFYNNLFYTLTVAVLSSCSGTTDTMNGTTPNQNSPTLYYFALTAINDEGIESGLSNIISKDTSNTGFAILNWTPPTDNIDGSHLILTGYKIYYGNAPYPLVNTINIDNSDITSFIVEHLNY